MPRYFYHVHDGTSLVDREGTELPDLKTARQEAVHLAGGLLKDDKGQFWDCDNWHIDVADEAGITLFSLHFTSTEPQTVAPSRAQALASSRGHGR